MRSHTPDVMRAAPRGKASAPMPVPLQAHATSQQNAIRKPAESKKRRPAFIWRKGLAAVPKGHAARKILGRAPARILKEVRQGDIAKKFNLPRDRRSMRKRNFGANLTYEEAKDKWMNWYNRHH